MKINAQEIFDTIVQHLHDTPRQAANSTGLCRYRTEDGLKCAVGTLITDEEYEPRMDKLGVVTEVHREGLLPERLTSHVSLLRRLQSVHDDHMNWLEHGRGKAQPAHMGAALRTVAAEYGLSTVLVDKLFS